MCHVMQTAFIDARTRKTSLLASAHQGMHVRDTEQPKKRRVIVIAYNREESKCMDKKPQFGSRERNEQSAHISYSAASGIV